MEKSSFQQIDDILAGSQNIKKDDEIFGDVINVLMREFHQQYSEIMAMPLPLIFTLLEKWNKEQKEIKRKMDKR
jgi:hypothetical protein